MPDFTRTALLAGFCFFSAASFSYAETEIVGRSDRPAETSPLSRPYSLPIESTFSISLPIVAGSTSEEKIKQLAIARSFLYQVANQECEFIKKVFIADCRLKNVRVSSNVQTRGMSEGEMINASASASYEVTISPK